MSWEWNTANVLVVIGWAVTFVLGIVTAVVVQRLGKVRKRVSWTLIGESSLLSQHDLEGIQSGFGVPVGISIEGRPVDDLSILKVRLGNTGNAHINAICIHFSFGDQARVYVGRYVGDLGVYRDALKLEKTRNKASLSIGHMNKGQVLELEFLVSNYEPGGFSADMAEPEVELRQTENLAAELSVSKGALASFSMGLLGVRYEPAAVQTSLLVQEVKALRRAVERASNRSDA